ncbi:cyclase family protein [Natronomonas sp.]|uniref:cyclase family protein n=1 Tax=Natronomonas sp. TaxID=2184060 RepID=UPI002FC2804E
MHQPNCAACADRALADGGTTPDVADLLDGLPDNWGRWGDDDERGTLNLLGSREAAAGMNAALKNGEDAVERFTLGLPLTGEAISEDGGTGDPGFPGREVARRTNVSDERAYREGDQQASAGMKFSDDRFETPFYLQGTTHMDALGHAWYGDELYNGVDAAETAVEKRFETPVEGIGGEVTETRGHGRLSVAPLAGSGVAGRGVLLDVGRYTGGSEGDRLPMGTEISLDDLQVTAEAQGIEIRERDILLVRTGAMARTRDPDADWHPTDEPGLVFSEELVEWVHDHDIAAVGADNVAIERVTQRIDGETYVLPLHGAFLRNLGLPLVEMLWLDDLARACADDEVYDFLFTAAPLHVQRATGGPLNPLVLKATEE